MPEEPKKTQGRQFKKKTHRSGKSIHGRSFPFLGKLKRNRRLGILIKRLKRSLWRRG